MNGVGDLPVDVACCIAEKRKVRSGMRGWRLLPVGVKMLVQMCLSPPFGPIFMYRSLNGDLQRTVAVVKEREDIIIMSFQDIHNGLHLDVQPWEQHLIS